MSTRKNKRIEIKGSGLAALKGLGKLYQNGEPKKVLIFAEREPDNLLAAALICYAYNEDFTVQFTDRHNINYDITKYCEEFDFDTILISCSSINEYSVLYLDRLSKPYFYIGSTTKLQEYINTNIHLTNTPVSSVVAGYLHLDNNIIKEVGYYTERYFPKSTDLYSCIRYQYLCFKYTAKDLFFIFLEQLINGNNSLELNEGTENELKSLYLKQLDSCDKAIEQAVIKRYDNKTFVFIQGGCPCTLILNRAMRSVFADVYINVCIHRQHFTVLADSEIRDIYKQYIEPFIYSGRGIYSAGGCFEKNCSLDKFINSFLNHYKIHGFYNDRLNDYKDFDPEEYEWIPCSLFMTDKIIYKNFNFTIFIDNYCNADCKFCIEQIKTENTGKIEKQRICSKNEYIERLDYVLKKVRPLNPSISITGGEPLLSSYFDDVMKLLKKYRFRKTVITTNGSGIEKHIKNIIDAGISHINFSRPHYNTETVQDIMRFRDRNHEDLFKNFENIISRLENGRVRTRFNCILSKNGINSVSEMKKYMDFVRLLGCKHVVFRELMSFNEKSAVNKEKKQYAEQNRVYINELWKEIDNDPDFKYFMNMQGHYYYIEIYKYRDMIMVSERANLKSLEDNREKNKNYIYEMIFHPNGNLCTSWIENEEILDKYKKDK